MKLLKSFIACFSTYSRIPMPTVNLDSDDMKYSLIFFPFIGALIGAVQYVIFLLSKAYSIPNFFTAVAFAVLPILVTGGIHIDGYMDTMDAFNSYGDKDKKLAIMKDPNTGAFAVIYFAVYFSSYIALAYLIDEKSIILFCISFVVSRILSGISVMTIKNARQSGMVSTLTKNSEKKPVLVMLFIYYILVISLVFYMNKIYAAVLLFVSVAGYFIYRKKVLKEIDGMTGDTSGYYLCIMELVLLACSLTGGIL